MEKGELKLKRSSESMTWKGINAYEENISFCCFSRPYAKGEITKEEYEKMKKDIE
jgi:uncharacterized membrane protein